MTNAAASSAINYPTDEHGNALHRSMGLPIVSSVLKIGGANYVDLIDLSASGDRVFIGLSIVNPDTSNSILIALGDDFNTNQVVQVSASATLAFDNLTFGYGIVDPVSKVRAKKIRAKLSSTSGTLATGTINYHNGGAPIQPTDGMCVELNGKVYEFSSDASKAPTSDFLVAIGVDADTSWTNLKNVINLRVAGGYGDQSIAAAINTATDIITVTSEYGGTSGNAIAMVDGDALGANTTGAVISATLSGGVGGVLPIVHAW